MHTIGSEDQTRIELYDSNVNCGHWCVIGIEIEIGDNTHIHKIESDRERSHGIDITSFENIFDL